MGGFFPQFKKILIIATYYMFIVSKQDITKFHLLQIAGMIEPSDIYTDLDTSRIVQGAFLHFTIVRKCQWQSQVSQIVTAVVRYSINWLRTLTS